MLQYNAFMASLYEGVFLEPYSPCEEGPLMLEEEVTMVEVTLPAEHVDPTDPNSPIDPNFPEEVKLIPLVGEVIAGNALRASGDETFEFEIYSYHPFDFDPNELDPNLAAANFTMGLAYGKLRGPATGPNDPNGLVAANILAVDSDEGRRVQFLPHAEIDDPNEIEVIEAHRAVLETWLEYRMAREWCSEVEDDPVYQECVRKADRELDRNIDRCSNNFKNGLLRCGGAGLLGLAGCLRVLAGLTWVGWLGCAGVAIVSVFVCGALVHGALRDCLRDARDTWEDDRSECCEEACARTGLCLLPTGAVVPVG